AHHAFDQSFAVMRRKEHYNVTALRIVPFGDVPGCERDLEVVRQLIHIDAVTFHYRRFHRTGRHVAPVRQRGPEREYHQAKDQERADLLLPPKSGLRAESTGIHLVLTTGEGGCSIALTPRAQPLRTHHRSTSAWDGIEQVGLRFTS